VTISFSGGTLPHTVSQSKSFSGACETEVFCQSLFHMSLPSTGAEIFRSWNFIFN